MNIPCKQIKCLKYPACKNREFITCTLLREYCDEIAQTYAEEGQDIWTMLYIDFPILLGVQLDQASKGSDISNVKSLLLNRHKIPMQMIQDLTWKLKDSK
jgi:hypothetical protein